jgi:hypothetical protein
MKQATFDQMVELAASVPDARDLIRDVQRVIFGADPATGGKI